MIMTNDYRNLKKIITKITATATATITVSHGYDVLKN